MPEKFLKLPVVMAQTGLSRSTVYLKVNAGEFPQPIKQGLRSIAFLESEVVAWIESRVAASRTGRAA